MTQIQIKVSPQTKLVRQGLQNLAKETPLIGQGQVFKTMQSIQTRMKQAGSPVKHPVHWDSDKQRRKFFATDGFDGGIPHKRIGEYQKAWRIVKVDNGYMIVNQSRGAPFIGGDAFGLVHSAINMPQEWPNFRAAVDDEISKLPQEIQKELRLAKRRNGFK